MECSCSCPCSCCCSCCLLLLLGVVPEPLLLLLLLLAVVLLLVAVVVLLLLLAVVLLLTVAVVLMAGSSRNTLEGSRLEPPLCARGLPPGLPSKMGSKKMRSKDAGLPPPTDSWGGAGPASEVPEALWERGKKEEGLWECDRGWAGEEEGEKGKPSGSCEAWCARGSPGVSHPAAC